MNKYIGYYLAFMGGILAAAGVAYYYWVQQLSRDSNDSAN